MLLEEFGFKIYPEKNHVSTEIIVITYLLTIYKKIYIYGFDYIGKPNPKYKLENEFINILHKRGLIDFF